MRQFRSFQGWLAQAACQNDHCGASQSSAGHPCTRTRTHAHSGHTQNHAPSTPLLQKPIVTWFTCVFIVSTDGRSTSKTVDTESFNHTRPCPRALLACVRDSVSRGSSWCFPGGLNASGELGLADRNRTGCPCAHSSARPPANTNGADGVFPSSLSRAAAAHHRPGAEKLQQRPGGAAK